MCFSAALGMASRPREAAGAASPPACHSARTYPLAMRPAAGCSGAFKVLRVGQVRVRSRRWQSAASAHTRACSKACCVKMCARCMQMLASLS